jgi:hypothetical protein
VIFAPSRLVGRATAASGEAWHGHLDALVPLVSSRAPDERWAFAAGWAALLGVDSRRCSIQLFLSPKAGGSAYLFSTNRFRRRDVAEALAALEAEWTGFQALIPLASVPPGDYRVGARVAAPGGSACVDFGHDLHASRTPNRERLSNTTLVSVHVPKTGGESFLKVLQDLHPGRVFRDILTEPLLPLRLRMLRWPLTRVARHLVPAQAECIHGHFLATKYEHSLPNARTAIWFREPAARLVSDFHYILRTPMLFTEHSLQRRIQGGRLDLEGFVRQRLYRDLQSTYLDGRSLESLDFVGIQEHFDRSMELFRRVIGAPRGVAVETRNANPTKAIGEEYEIPADLRRFVERHHPRDTDLYRRALRRFEELCRAHGLG